MKSIQAISRQVTTLCCGVIVSKYVCKSTRFAILILAVSALLAGCQSSSNESAAESPESAVVENGMSENTIENTISDDASGVSPADTDIPDANDASNQTDTTNTTATTDTADTTGTTDSNETVNSSEVSDAEIDNAVVSQPAPSDLQVPSVDLSLVYDDVIELLAGFQLDQLDLVVADIMQFIEQTMTINAVGDGFFIIEGDIFTTETASLVGYEYACENGGSVFNEMVEAWPVRDVVAGTINRGKFNRHGYLFEQCRVTLRDGPLPDGSYLLDGSLYSEFRDYFEFGNHRHSYTYNAFSITGDNGLVYRVQGDVVFSYLEDVVSIVSNRRANITEYYMQPSGFETGDTITDVQYSFDSEFSNAPRISNNRLDVSGSVRHGQTDTNTVSVSTASVLTAHIEGDDTLTPAQGMIEMRSENGGVLHLHGIPVADPEVWYALHVDIDYTGADGNQTSLSRVPYMLPDHDGPTCRIAQAEGMRQLECDDS